VVRIDPPRAPGAPCFLQAAGCGLSVQIPSSTNLKKLPSPPASPLRRSASIKRITLKPHAPLAPMVSVTEAAAGGRGEQKPPQQLQQKPQLQLQPLRPGQDHSQPAGKVSAANGIEAVKWALVSLAAIACSPSSIVLYLLVEVVAWLMDRESEAAARTSHLLAVEQRWLRPASLSSDGAAAQQAAAATTTATPRVSQLQRQLEGTQRRLQWLQWCAAAIGTVAGDSVWTPPRLLSRRSLALATEACLSCASQLVLPFARLVPLPAL